MITHRTSTPFAGETHTHAKTPPLNTTTIFFILLHYISFVFYICRSWDAFQMCVSGVLSGCRGDAAEIWESLRAESRKTAFAGNLYDTCASRTQAVTATTPLVPSTDQTNRETLRGLARSVSHSVSEELLMTCFFLLLLLRM